MKNAGKFLAVSLKYPEYCDAPFISCKAEGLLAQKMVEIAGENGVPLVKDDVTAGVLSLHRIGECIPECTWDALSAVFAAIKMMDGRFEE